MSQHHPTALIDPGAKIASDTVIGPFCHVGGSVEIASGVVLKSHVVVTGNIRIGEGTLVYPFACLGEHPQDLKYEGEDSRLVIGQGCVIREHVTAHPGTKGGGGVTTIGDGCVLMVGVHIAHDCHLGEQVIMSNNATLAGHVKIGSYAILGGLCAVHQFVEIGEHAFIAGMVGVERNVIPYGMVTANRGHLEGLNLVGLRRRGFNNKQIARLQETFRVVFEGEGIVADRLAKVRSTQDKADTLSQNFLDFVERSGRRGLLGVK